MFRDHLRSDPCAQLREWGVSPSWYAANASALDAFVHLLELNCHTYLRSRFATFLAAIGQDRFTLLFDDFRARYFVGFRPDRLTVEDNFFKLSRAEFTKESINSPLVRSLMHDWARIVINRNAFPLAIGAETQANVERFALVVVGWDIYRVCAASDIPKTICGDEACSFYWTDVAPHRIRAVEMKILDLRALFRQHE